MIQNILYEIFFSIIKLYVPYKGSEIAYYLQIIQFSQLNSLHICVRAVCVCLCMYFL